MSKLKKMLFGIAFTVWKIPQSVLLKRLKNYSVLYVIDIDNTLTVSELGNPLNHSNPTPRAGMIKYVKNLISCQEKVIYLTARDFRIKKPTIQWLTTNNIFDNLTDVFFVQSAAHKIPYLKYLHQNNKKIVFIDDLSYNHENGEVKKYAEVENIISQMSIEYKGINYIESLV